MDSNGGYGVAQDGSKIINITTPWLEQSFPVTVGLPYTVTYYEALRADGNGQPDTLQVTISLAAGTATGVTSQFANNPLTNNISDPHWVKFSFEFTPDTTTIATLRFTLFNGAGYPVIDNIDVVPEPTSLSMFGIRSASLFAVARRGRKGQVRRRSKDAIA